MKFVLILEGKHIIWLLKDTSAFFFLFELLREAKQLSAFILFCLENTNATDIMILSLHRFFHYTELLWAKLSHL